MVDASPETDAAHPQHPDEPGGTPAGSKVDAGAETDASRPQRPDEVQARFARLCAGRDSSAMPAPGQWTDLETPSWPSRHGIDAHGRFSAPAITRDGLVVTARTNRMAAEADVDEPPVYEVWANLHVPNCGWIEPVQIGLSVAYDPEIRLTADRDHVLAKWRGREHERHSRFDGEHWSAAQPLVPREAEVPSTSPTGHTLEMVWYDDVEVGPGAPFAAVPKLPLMDQVHIDGGFAFAGVNLLPDGAPSTELWFGHVRGDEVVVNLLSDVVLSSGGQRAVAGFTTLPDEPHFALAATPSGSEALLVYADASDVSTPDSGQDPPRPVYVRFLRNGAWTEPERIATIERDPGSVVDFTATLLDNGQAAVSWGHLVEEQGQLYSVHFETRSYREDLGWSEPGAGQLPDRTFDELGLLGAHDVVTLQVPDGTGGWVEPLRVDGAVLNWGRVTTAGMAALPAGGWLLYGKNYAPDGYLDLDVPSQVATWSPGAGLDALTWPDMETSSVTCDTSVFGDAVCWTDTESEPRMTLRIGDGP